MRGPAGEAVEARIELLRHEISLLVGRDDTDAILRLAVMRLIAAEAGGFNRLKLPNRGEN